MNEWVRLAIGCLLLLAIAVGVSARADLHTGRQQITAALRAVVQLSVIALALRGVFAAPIFVVLVIAVMFTVAVLTSARRLRDLPGAPRAVAIACSAGAGVVLTIIVGLPTLDRNLRTLVAAAGIVIGGTMAAATLAGRHLLDGLRARREEVEGWLAIGATPRQAKRDIVRHSAAEALVPGLDQTKTVGLVTLPGAFIGALLGGASPVDAARFQIVVLIGLMCAQVIAAATLTFLLGASPSLPRDQSHTM